MLLISCSLNYRTLTSFRYTTMSLSPLTRWLNSITSLVSGTTSTELLLFTITSYTLTLSNIDLDDLAVRGIHRRLKDKEWAVVGNVAELCIKVAKISECSLMLLDEFVELKICIVRLSSYACNEDLVDWIAVLADTQNKVFATVGHFTRKRITAVHFILVDNSIVALICSDFVITHLLII
jgi:hypothetical protein